MSFVIFLILLAVSISEIGVFATLTGLLVGLGIDIPVLLLVGGTVGQMFSWGLVDDIVVVLFRLGLDLPDKFLLAIAAAQATHLIEEAVEYEDETDQQRRRYSAYLRREHPGQTYIYGDVTHADVIELGFSLGVLGYRQIPASVWQVGIESFEEIL